MTTLFDLRGSHSNQSWVFVLAMLIAWGMPAWTQDVAAQNRVLPPVAVFPHQFMERSITAQGDIIRAQGDAFRKIAEGNVLNAQARQQLAIAVEMELDNVVKYAETYYDRRLMGLRKKAEVAEELEKRKDKYGEIRDSAKQRLLNRLLTDREQSKYAITNGSALNELLYALNKTPVAFNVDLGPTVTSQIDQRLGLNRNNLDAIKIRTPGGQSQTVTLTQTTGINLSWWPDHLRQKDYGLLRSELEETIESINAIAAGGDRIDRVSIAQLNSIIKQISQQYNDAYPADRCKHLSTAELQQLLRTQDFLTRLHGDLQRIRHTGRAETMGSAEPFDPRIQGRDALSLARWMLQNGIVFEKASAGDEAHYYQIFAKLRDLYSMVSI